MRRTERVQFFTADGIRLTGILELPAEEPKAFALFSHCFTCTKDLKASVRICRELAARGWGVLRYDFRGLGESSGRFAESCFLTNQEDLRSAVRFLAEKYQAPRVLIGHSLGGATSLATASEVDSARGVVTLAAPSDTHHLGRLLLRMNPSIETNGEGEVIIGGIRHTVSMKMVNVLLEFDLTSRLDLLSKPVLSFHGTRDETLAFHHVMELVKALEGKCSLVVLKDSDHLFVTKPEDIAFIAESIDLWARRNCEVA